MPVSKDDLSSTQTRLIRLATRLQWMMAVQLALTLLVLVIVFCQP